MREHSHHELEPGGEADSARGIGVTLTLLPRWRVLALARVADYVLLRRQLGRAGVERLIFRVATRIGGLVPEGRVVAIKQDVIEFAFEGEMRESVEASLTRLDALLDETIGLDHENHSIELHIGAAVSDGSPIDEVRMVEQAEAALAQADADTRVVIRDLAQGADAVDRIALAHDLSHAVDRGELFLVYQPKIHLRRHKVASVEALIRWRHPERGLVLPGDFIPIAEETRLIASMTLWTIGQALADQALLARDGHDLRVFVNISGVLLGDPAFVKHASILVCDGAERIGFEVTETSVIRDPEIAIANLQAFANMGVEIAIDDYGAGLSSLAYLKRLPARELKIDKLFVTQLTSTNRDPLIVRSTIDLAHALDMAVVAEGVETQAALALLSVMGCDMAQGFLISRPVNFSSLLIWLNEGNHAQALEESRAAFVNLAATWKRAR